MPRMSLNWRIDGKVASPTPMMPISSDSTSSMATPRSPVASAAADIQPAEPPPRMTMRRMPLIASGRFGALPQEVGIGQGAALQAALLGLEIHMHEAEAPLVTE